MSDTLFRATTLPTVQSRLTSRTSRSVIVLTLVAGSVGGLVLGARASGVTNEVELTHLLRAMAMLKLLFVAAASAAIFWRLQAPIAHAKLSAYALACLAMAAGPGLIWYLAYLGPASLLLHGGVAASAILLWRDDASSVLLERAIAKRRAALLPK